ncbi:MAG: hypothetical protein ACQEVA_00685 [Myxococcota bacterium]
MSKVRPQTRQQAILTALLSWFVLAYIASLGGACVCTNSGQEAASGLDSDVALSVGATAVASSHDVDARLLAAAATIERIKSMETLERLDARASSVERATHPQPVPRLQLAPKTSPPKIS